MSEEKPLLEKWRDTWHPGKRCTIGYATKEVEVAVRELREETCDWYTHEEDKGLCDEDERYKEHTGQDVCWTCEKIFKVFGEVDL